MRTDWLSGITRLLGVTLGETARFVRVAALFFTLMAGWGIGRACRDSLFIKEVGPAGLPWMYILNAFLLIAATALYARYVDRLDRGALMGSLIGGGAAALLGLRALLAFRGGGLAYIVFAATELLALFTLMHFWTYLNEIFNPREGKRLFPLIGGAGLIGNILGGALTPAAVGLVGTPNLLLAWAGILLGCLPLVACVRAAATDFRATPASLEADPVTYARSVTRLLAFPVVRTLAKLSLPMWLVVYIVDYQFFRIMNDVFPERSQFTGFLGIFNSIASVTGLGLQVFLTGWLLRTYGVGAAVLCHPISMLVGSAGLLYQAVSPTTARHSILGPGFTGALAKFSDNAVFYSVGDSATQLLFNALPESWRGRARAFVSGTVEPACTAAAGAVLLLLNQVEVSGVLLAAITVGLCVVWLMLTVQLGSDYLRTLVSSLGSQDLQSGDSVWGIFQLSEQSTLALLAQRAGGEDPEEARFALDLLAGARTDASHRALAELLPRLPDDLQIRAMDDTATRADGLPQSVLLRLIRDGSPAVCSACLRACRASRRRLPDPLLAELLDRRDGVEREAAVMALASDGGARPRAVEYLNRLCTNPTGLDACEALYVIGEARFRDREAFVAQHLDAPDLEARRSAVNAAGCLGTPVLIEGLLAELDADEPDARVESAVRRGGPVAVEAVLNGLRATYGRKDSRNARRACALLRCVPPAAFSAETGLVTGLLDHPLRNIRRAALEVLDDSGRADDWSMAPEIRDRIGSLLHGFLAEVEEARQIAGGLDALRRDHPDAALLLAESAKEWQSDSERAALACLGLLAGRENVETARRNLHATNPRTRAEAIEILEMSCPDGRRFVQVLDADQTGVSGMTPAQTLKLCFERLTTMDPTGWTLACCHHAARELDHDLPPSGGDSTAPQEAEAMSENIRRILFLKSVGLFREVDAGELQWVDRIARRETFSGNDVVFREGDPGNALYVISRGKVRVVKGENDTLLAVLEERDSFGEMALIDEEPRSATIIADGPTELLVIHRPDFEKLILERPAIATFLLRSLSRRLREANARLTGSA